MESPQRPRHAIGSAAAFRPSAKQYALHPLEKALMLTVIALLVFLPWALGGMKLWAQQIGFGLAALAFVLSLIPRTYDDRYHAGGDLRLHMGPKLRRFPIFWLGLVYFAVVVTQILNPAWSYRSNDYGWWLVGLEYIRWLPHGIEGTPFEKMNGWRTLMIHGAVWFMVCALWVGMIRRKTARIILTVTALNGLVVAATVILQRLTGTKKLLWLWEAPTDYFASSFIYKNHAGEFLNLILALCLGLAWWHTIRAERYLKKSNPGMAWLLASVAVVFGQMLTYARAATIIGVAFIMAIGLGYAVRQAFRNRGGPPRIVTVITMVLALGFLSAGLLSLNTENVWLRFEKLYKQDVFSSVTSRKLATQATLNMAEDSWITGHGVGGFRFLFPQYQQHYQKIYRPEIREGNKVVSWRLYWEHAHNDYAELLAELGLVGFGLATAVIICCIVAARQSGLTSHPDLLVVLGGPIMVAATAAVDFPIHNPAVLFTAAAVTAIVLRWAQLSRR